jgi:TolB-like protein
MPAYERTARYTSLLPFPASGEAAGEAGLRRVAVLPFENLGEPDKAYFADGITDEIRGKLATVAGLRLPIGQNARVVIRHGKQSLSPREIRMPRH